MAKSKSREFQYLIESFPKTPSQKINEDVFDGLQIREMLYFDPFEATIGKSQKQSCLSFKFMKFRFVECKG